MSEEIEEQDSPFEAGNPSRRRVDRSDIPDSVQAPQREAVEDLTRGKRKKGGAIKAVLMLALLGGGLYYLFGMSDKPTVHHRKNQEALTPSDTAGTTVVSGAKDAEAQLEQQRKQAAAARGLDPNAAAGAAIAGQAAAPAGASASRVSASQAVADAAAAKQAADAKAEKEAQIAASPLQANDVQLLRSVDGGRSAAPLSAADQLAEKLTDQMKANQAAADRQMDRVMEMSSAYGGQGSGGSSTVAGVGRASQQDQWLASQKADDGAPIQNHAAPRMPIVGEGTPVRAVLQTGLDTDNPGRVKAMVTSDVYDTFTGHTLMIPKGSILMGDYNHDVSVGQERVLIAMTRLIRPDGSWVDLSGTTGDEMDGSSGLDADVNNHFWKIFGSALVVGAATLLLDQSQQNVTLSQGLGATQMGGTIFAQTLQKVVSDLLSRNQKIPPTLTRTGGTQFMFLVRHDLALSPYYRR